MSVIWSSTATILPFAPVVPWRIAGQAPLPHTENTLGRGRSATPEQIRDPGNALTLLPNSKGDQDEQGRTC